MANRPRGGVRIGAGRKPSVADRPTSVKSFTLDERTIGFIDEWAADPANKARSASEALRQIVDVAIRASRGLEHPCPSCGGPMKSWRPGATCLTCRNKKGGAATRGVRRVQTSAQRDPLSASPATV